MARSSMSREKEEGFARRVMGFRDLKFSMFTFTVYMFVVATPLIMFTKVTKTQVGFKNKENTRNFQFRTAASLLWRYTLG